jgi:hypothetical protein
MRPLSEIDPSVLARVEGVVFDVDDTLTRDGRVERVAFDALWRLSEAGLVLVAVTGRPLGWTDVMAMQWPIDLAVGENGAGWSWQAQRALHAGYFHDGATRAEHTALLDRVRARVAEAMPHVKLAIDQHARRCDLAFDVGEREDLPREQIDALVALVEALGARCPVSTVHAHVIPGDWDKACGVVRALAEARSIAVDPGRERFLFVGDSGNDAAAFEAFPLSVGVANVRNHLDRLPVPPAWVTGDDRGRGFAELAGALLSARA